MPDVRCVLAEEHDVKPEVPEPVTFRVTLVSPTVRVAFG
jgi:hypothetical protein